MPKFSANVTLLFRELPLLQRIQAAGAAGFRAIEIQSPENAPIDDIAKVAKQVGVQIILCNIHAGDFVQGGLGLSGIPGRKTEFQQAVTQVVEMASALGCSLVNISPSRVPKNVEREACMEVLAENLNYAANALSSLGVRVLVEPLNTNEVPDVLISRIDEARAVIKLANHENLGVQFDVYHTAQMEEDFIQTFKDNVDHIHHIQFADVPGRGQPGTGGLNFTKIFDVVDASAYDGWVAAEYIPTCSTGDTLAWFSDD